MGATNCCACGADVEHEHSDSAPGIACARCAGATTIPGTDKYFPAQVMSFRDPAKVVDHRRVTARSSPLPPTWTVDGKPREANADRGCVAPGLNRHYDFGAHPASFGVVAKSLHSLLDNCRPVWVPEHEFARSIFSKLYGASVTETKSLARALFETSPQVIAFVTQVSDCGRAPSGAAKKAAYGKAMATAWERDEGGWRKEAEERAKRVTERMGAK